MTPFATGQQGNTNRETPKTLEDITMMLLLSFSVWPSAFISHIIVLVLSDLMWFYFVKLEDWEKKIANKNKHQLCLNVLQSALQEVSMHLRTHTDCSIFHLGLWTFLLWWWTWCIMHCKSFQRALQLVSRGPGTLCSSCFVVSLVVVIPSEEVLFLFTIYFLSGCLFCTPDGVLLPHNENAAAY